jgi:hypothetical protein
VNYFGKTINLRIKMLSFSNIFHLRNNKIKKWKKIDIMNKNRELIKKDEIKISGVEGMIKIN